MSESASPRKSFSFFLIGNRAGHGFGKNNSNRPKPTTAASDARSEGVFLNGNMATGAAAAKVESDISVIENPLQKMTFRVANPDPETSSSENGNDNDDDSEYEVIRPTPSSVIEGEKTMVPEEDEGVDGDSNDDTFILPPPPAAAAATVAVPTHILPSTPPATESSQSSPDMRQKSLVELTMAPNLYIGRGWKVSNGSEAKQKRQSKIMFEEEASPQIEEQRGASMDSLRHASDDSGSSLLPSPRFPLSPSLPQQPLVFSDRRHLSNQPRNTRARPSFQQQPPHPQVVIPPARHGRYSAPGYSPFMHSSAPRTSLNAPVPKAGLTIATFPSKYNKASYSLTNHPDAIKIYRTMAEKTCDPIVQLTYAKYLLEISDLYDVNENGGRSRRPSTLTQDTSINNVYGRALSVDITTSSSRVSLNSVLSAPVIGNSNTSSSGSNPSASPAKRALSEANRKKKKMLEDEGVRWIKLLSKQNVGEAAYMMAEWLQHGTHGISKNPTKAHKFYKVAAAEFVPEAMYEMGKLYEKSGNTVQALSNYQGAAEKGVVEAIYRVARIHLIGQLGQRQNVSLGLAFLTQAAKLATEKCPEPPYLFGLILTNAYPKVDISMETIHQLGGELAALRCFEHAAQLGFSHAQSRIAFIYEYGLYGAPMNFAKSFAYYDVAARENNHPQAMLGLSRLYNRGCRGPGDVVTEAERLARDVSGWLSATTRNEDAAFNWCQKAADQGLDDAMFLLGWYYETGVGVLRDYERAAQLYTKAAAKGHVGAADRLQQPNSVTSQQHKDTKRDFRASKSISCVLM